jgi:hypothetical protein
MVVCIFEDVPHCVSRHDIPVGPYRFLTSNVPHVKLEALMIEGLDVKALHI